MPNRILGIDPGMALMGYGLIEDNGGDLSAITYGVLSTTAEQSVSQRLRFLYRGVCEVIERYQPSDVAVELFIARNLRTALMVGQARGVAILAAANKEIPVYEYTPLQVKLIVSGYGRADKKQIQEMVRLQLGLSSIPEPDDAADALAIAICHTSQVQLSRLLATQR
ncbi:crossover junction endodeoxyribonuclease RuvC [Chloroflexota bacterium]